MPALPTLTNPRRTAAELRERATELDQTFATTKREAEAVQQVAADLRALAYIIERSA